MRICRWCLTVAVAGSSMIVSLLLIGCSCEGDVTPEKQAETVRETAAYQSAERREGRRILEETARAYAELKAFSCRVTTTATAEYPSGHRPVERGFADLSFRRGESLSVSGEIPAREETGMHLSYEFRVDSEGVRFRSDVEDGSGWKTEPDLQSVLVAYMGALSHAHIFLCSLLLKLEWKEETEFLPKGDLIKALSASVYLLREDRIGDSECYVLAGQYAFVPVRLFIRKKDHMVLRCRQVWNEEDIKRFDITGRARLTFMDSVHEYTDIVTSR